MFAQILLIPTIIDELKKVNGDLSLLEFKKPSSMNNLPEFIYTLEKTVGKLHFNNNPLTNMEDLHNGLTLCINDTWGDNISIKDYEFDGKKFKGTICFTIYDNFGLDFDNIEKTVKKMGVDVYVFKHHDGFPAWFVLQHYDKLNGKYKPFVDYVYFERTFEGTVE